MPIYEYRCGSCGYQSEFLQKIKDDPIRTCPQCNSAEFTKLVSAAGFQLKGSGWYATDFKGSGSRPAAKEAGGSAESSKEEAKPAAASESATSSSSDGTKAAGCGGGCACHS